jgi:outer membrane protein OmpA-like peptidoglycan-associated protein
MTTPTPARRLAAGLLVAALGLAVPGCQTNTGTVLDKKTTQGAILGTLAGAAAGAAIDKKAGRGALIGAAVGGLTGGLVGNYLDKQAREIDAIPDANVERRDDVLLVNFGGDVLFDTGSANLAAGAHSRLRSLADTLSRYPETQIVVKGHTDSSGSETVNQALSERRADSVRNFLVAEGVDPSRVTSVGLGESYPLVSNDTAAGRQQNRRVEIELRPTDELREQAERESGGSGGGDYR